VKSDPARRLPWYAPVIVLAVGFCCYANSLHGPFIFDDIDSLRNNPAIQSLTSPSNGGNTLSGRPVVRLSMVLDYSIDGLNVEIYHFTNILIHLCAALILLDLVRQTLLLPARWNGRFENSATPIAIVSAAIWVSQPLNTAAVTYLSQRVESMAAMFYLLAIYCFIRSARNPPHSLWWATCVFASALGMASKQTMATVPIAILLYDRTFLAGSFRNALAQRWKIHAGIFATWLVLIATTITQESNANSRGFAHGISSLDYARTQLDILAHYIVLIVWPHNLVFDEGNWPISRHFSDIHPAGWLVAILIVATLIALWKKPVLGFACA
jgi:4-amino-4-deoxy-L-arabinose transferase-like glycosyltransferase